MSYGPYLNDMEDEYTNSIIKPIFESVVTTKPTGLVINRNGVIEDLTAEQAVAVLVNMLRAGVDERATMTFDMVDLRRVICLPDGSRIELKEEDEPMDDATRYALGSM